MKRIYTQTPVAELKVGMYITELDRPWLDTPFLLQGFLVESREDIDTLAQHCQFVYVDYGLSKVGDNPQEEPASQQQGRLTALFPHRDLKPYRDETSVEQELKTARPILDRLTKSVKRRFDTATEGAQLATHEVREACKQMVDSIGRNPDAMLWLNRLKVDSEYNYQHAISVSIWMVALGRQLGLPKIDLCTLAIGGVLLDIGKTQIPRHILEKTGRLSPAEFALVKRHVELGLYEIEKTGGINREVLEIIECHHERFDSSGYPKGLPNKAIPVFARIAAIADCYGAITTSRPYAQAISPCTAINKLFEWRDKDFQAELVEEFIQAIGIYPAGTLVELSSGEVGIVLSEYRARRLRPKIIQLLDANKQPLNTVKVIDLLETTHDAQGKELSIVEGLEPGAYDIDLSELDL